MSDSGQAITVDALGQSWVSGYTLGSLGGTINGSYDLFLSRVSASGSVDFTRQRGGTRDDYGYGVALVGSGTVFIGGDTFSSTMDGQASLGFLSDALAVRFDSSGTWQGTTRFGGTSQDYVYAAAGNSTNLLVAGWTGSFSFDGNAQAGGGDAFLSKRDSTGALVWTRFAATSVSDIGEAAAFDNAGNAYLAGNTQGSFPGFTNPSTPDFFVARFDPAGNQTLLVQLGTSTNDVAYGVAVDGDQNIYLTGFTDGALGGQTPAGYDAFLTKLDSDGNVLWTRLLGGDGSDQSLGVGLDGQGHVWIGGYTSGDFAGHTNIGGTDAFVAQYDSDGLLLGTTFLATPFNDEIQGLAIGPDGGAYVVGYTRGVLGGSYAGGNDVFVAKIVPEPSTALLLAGGCAALLLLLRRA